MAQNSKNWKIRPAGNCRHNRFGDKSCALASRRQFCPDRANQFDRFAPIHLARPAFNGAKSLAPKNQFLGWIQSDWVVQP
jgi:hypothetical protein